MSIFDVIKNFKYGINDYEKLILEDKYQNLKKFFCEYCKRYYKID